MVFFRIPLEINYFLAILMQPSQKAWLTKPWESIHIFKACNVTDTAYIRLFVQWDCNYEEEWHQCHRKHLFTEQNFQNTSLNENENVFIWGFHTTPISVMHSAFIFYTPVLDNHPAWMLRPPRDNLGWLSLNIWAVSLTILFPCFMRENPALLDFFPYLICWVCAWFDVQRNICLVLFPLCDI